MDLETFFTGVTVGDLFPRCKEIVTFKETDKISDCLEVLDSEQILSAPVVNAENKIIGVVDVLAIALFALGLFPKDVPLEDLTEENLQTVIRTGKRFDTSPISDVLELTQLVKTDYEHLFTVKKSTPIPKLFELFYEGVHRVILLGDNGAVMNVISQSDLLAILAQCLPFVLEKDKMKTVEQLKLTYAHETPKELQKVKASNKTIAVLSKLQPGIRKPLLSAVPIEDDDGNLIGNFSASNLKGLGKDNFKNLLLPVVEFLSILPNTKRFLSNLSDAKSLRPITCSNSSTFEDVVSKMCSHKVHRLWVTEGTKLVGVISVGDVFKVFLPWAKGQH